MDGTATRTSSMYGSAWQRARAGFLRQHPLCKEHAARGATVLANVVDHIAPHRGDWQLFWDRDNWQSLCKSCHDSWKQRRERGGIDTGCSLHGLPTDPRHPWAQAMRASVGRDGTDAVHATQKSKGRGV